VSGDSVPGEVIETADYSDQDKIDLAHLGVNPDDDAKYHTILEVWREVLRPAAAEAGKKVTPQWANRMLAAYMGLTYADMDAFRDLYYERIGEMLHILEVEIKTDDDALDWATPEEDAAENSAHYKNMLLQWQLAVLAWEMDWNTTDEDAAVQIAVISEVHKMFLGDQGLVAWLENIRFEFTEADQAMLVATLMEFRGEEL
jgi:hypothetical protein